jgi:hypothetical protein
MKALVAARSAALAMKALVAAGSAALATKALVAAGTAALAVSALVPVPVSAQVGYPPTRSPYRDLVFRQELTAFTGYLSASKGRAGVAPTGGPVAGVRYEIRIGGPAEFTVRLMRAWTERTVIDPAKPVETRNLGTRAWPIYHGDVGITVNLTGQKSWRRLVPVINGGIGVASDANKGGDPVGFNIGTPFAFSFGAGVRWVPGGSFQLRADFSDFLYNVDYPDAYFGSASTPTVPPVLPARSSQGEWLHNRVLSIGASYLFFR